MGLKKELIHGHHLQGRHEDIDGRVHIAKKQCSGPEETPRLNIAAEEKWTFVKQLGNEVFKEKIRP